MFIFNSRFNTLMVVLRPTKKLVIGTQVVTETGARAEFKNGIFTTEDAEIAQLLRDKIKTSHDRDIVEINDEAQRAFVKLKKGGKNVRTGITAADLKTPALASSIKVAEPESDKALTCLICDKVFKNQKSLNIHLVSHRPEVQLAPKAEKKAPAEDPAEQTEPAPETPEA